MYLIYFLSRKGEFREGGYVFMNFYSQPRGHDLDLLNDPTFVVHRDADGQLFGSYDT